MISLLVCFARQTPKYIFLIFGLLDGVEICIFVFRRLLGGDWLAPKTLSKFQKICLVVPLVGSVACCPQEMFLSRLLENFALGS